MDPVILQPGDRVRWEYALPSNIVFMEGTVVRTLREGMAVVEWSRGEVRELVAINRLKKI